MAPMPTWFAAVAYQCAQIKANQVIAVANGHFRRAENTVFEVRVLQHEVEGIAVEQCVAEHEWQVLVDLGGECERGAAFGGALLHQADEIEGDIRIRTEAVTFTAFEGALRHHL